MSMRYPIPAHTVRRELIVKRSRFIATLGYADSVEAAKTFLQHIRDEMPDATHHVYAFRIGYGSSVIEGLSDDGEPAGTSGKPTMAVLRGADLGDVVIIITRYYGGTKLGTGGLVRAYSGAAKEAFEHLTVMEKVETVTVSIPIPYTHYEQVKRLLPDYEAQIRDETFEAHVTLQVRLPDDRREDFSAQIRDFSLGNVAPMLIEQS